MGREAADMGGGVGVKGGERAYARKGAEGREGECADGADSWVAERCVKCPDSRLKATGWK